MLSKVELFTFLIKFHCDNCSSLHTDFLVDALIRFVQICSLEISFSESLNTVKRAQNFVAITVCLLI